MKSLRSVFLTAAIRGIILVKSSVNPHTDNLSKDRFLGGFEYIEELHLFKPIETKLNPPKSPANLLSRKRLIDRLEAAVREEKTSILITAPAGYGKTSLAADWLARTKASSAWVTLDRSDNDLARFVQYVYAAMQRATGLTEWSALAYMDAPVHPPEEEIAPAIAGDFSTVKSKTILLLDDYHRITNRSVHGIIAHLLQHPVPDVLIALMTREDPPFPVARLRTQDLLLELRAGDLKFNQRETREFLESTGNFKLGENESAELAARTEGWAAGLKLAALSVQGLEGEVSQRLLTDFSGSNKYVIDYFGEEVLQNQPGRLIAFLEDTAHLAKLRADLCNAVTGRSDSEEILALLVHKNLFIAPIEGEEGWYRYHPLFARFLHVRFGGAKRADLHRKAVQWYAERKMYYEAVAHAEQIADWKMLKSVILEAAVSLLETGRHESLLSWLALLPEEPLLHDVKLTAYKGWALYFRNHAEDAFDLVQKNPAQKSDLIVLTSWLRYIFGEPADIRAIEEYIGTKKSVETFFLLHAHLLQGRLLLQSGDPKRALASAEASRQLAQNYGNPFFLACAVHLQAFCLIDLGERSQAEMHCDRILGQLSDDAESSRIYGGLLHIPAAFCRYLADDIQGAVLRIENARAGSGSRIIVDYTVDDGSRVEALIHLASGNFERAFGVASPRRRGKCPSLRDFVVADIALKKNEIEKAAQVIKTNTPEIINGGLSLTGYGSIVTLRLLLRLNRQADAISALSRLEALARERASYGSLFLASLFLSIALHQSGEKNRAYEHMSRALEMAEHDEYKRPFLDEGKTAEEIIRGMEAQPYSFAGALLVDFQQEGGLGYESSGFQSPYEQISRRERDVISLMAKGMSNKEIADALFISLGTVKWHINNIFGKLDVKNRTSAINRAREVGIISAQT